MNETDAQFLGVRHMTDLYLFPVDPDGAFVGLVHASEDLHPRRFSGAIFPDQRDDLARADREGDIAEGNDARESLSNAFEFENRFWHNRVSNAANVCRC